MVKKVSSSKKKKSKSNSKKSNLLNKIKANNFFVKFVSSIGDKKLFFMRAIPLLFGFLWLIVGLIDEVKNGMTLLGLFYGSIIGVIIIIISLLSWFHHLSGGILLIAAGFYAIMMIKKADILLISKIVMMITLALPLIIPGLYFSRKGFTLDNLDNKK